MSTTKQSGKNKKQQLKCKGLTGDIWHESVPQENAKDSAKRRWIGRDLTKVLYGLNETIERRTCFVACRFQLKIPEGSRSFELLLEYKTFSYQFSLLA